MVLSEPKRDPAAIEREESFKRSLAELSNQLASRSVADTPELPIASDDDDPEAPRRRLRWSRGPMLVALAVAIIAGYFAFRGDSAPHPAAQQARTVMVPAPPPPTGPAAPTTSDFAGASPSSDAKLAIAAPPPIDTQPPAQLAPLDRQGIQEVQRRLLSLGLNPGPVDGVAGRLTQSAVRRYQESKGQAATGQIDGGLLKDLRDEAPR